MREGRILSQLWDLEGRKKQMRIKSNQKKKAMFYKTRGLG